MRHTTSLLVFALALAGDSDALSQPPCPHGMCYTNPWVFLRDSNNAVRGSLRIVGSGAAATVQFRDPDGVVLEAPFGRALAGTNGGQGAAVLTLEQDPPPVPDIKTDAKGDIQLLQSQVSTLQRNLKALQARLNGN